MTKASKGKSALILNPELEDSNFALSTLIDPITDLPVTNPSFLSLMDAFKDLSTEDYGYVYVAPKNASAPTEVKISTDLAGINGAISTGNGKDKVDLSISIADNYISTGNGKDLVIGGSGNDTIETGNANDLITGGSDLGSFTQIVDPITQEQTFLFETGDVLTGGRGKDIFKYSLGDGVDLITDFKLGQDKLVLDEIELGDLILSTKDGDLYLGFNDGSGGMQEDAVIVLAGVEDTNTFLNTSVDFV